MKTLLRINGLSKKYGAAAALDGLDLKLESGHI